jgi:hypothetical protein
MSKFSFETCCVCGIEFGIPEHFINSRRKDGGDFTCPTGHTLSFGIGDNEKLRRERDRLKQQAVQKDAEIEHHRQARQSQVRTTAAYKGQITKLKNRAKPNTPNLKVV